MLAFGICLAAIPACRGEREAPAAASGPDDAPAARAAGASTHPQSDAERTAAAPPVEPGEGATPAPADAGPTLDAASPPAPADAGPALDVVLPPGGGIVGPAGGAPAVPEVPIENRERGERPGAESAEALARRLLPAILAGDPTPVRDLVFPLGPFTLLKDLPDPAAYHRRLVRWFEEDLRAKREELGGVDALEFRRFRFGRCEWVPKGGEGNRIPYWSCRRNRITAWTGRREIEVEIRVLIHWGRDWYVTHLGPVRR